VRKARTLHEAKSLTLVTYRRHALNVLPALVKAQVLHKKLQDVVTSVVSLEDIFHQRKLKAYLPLVPMVLNYVNLVMQPNRGGGKKNAKLNADQVADRVAHGRVAGHLTADELAWRLSDLLPQLSSKHGFNLGQVAKMAVAGSVEVAVAATPAYQGGHATYTVTNSENFVKKEFFPLEVSSGCVEWGRGAAYCARPATLFSTIFSF
jgi:hypothetical protein